MYDLMVNYYDKILYKEYWFKFWWKKKSFFFLHDFYKNPNPNTLATSAPPLYSVVYVYGILISSQFFF
jgi:hypothetical protein